MDSLELRVDSRDILGKKVRFLRRRGITPVHVIGHGLESLSLQCDTANLRQVLGQAGRTKLVNLKVGKERRARPTLVKEVQVEPMTGELLHVDFYQVRMADKVKMEVPLRTFGESPLLKLKGNILIQELPTISVECLASDIPESFTVDLNELTVVGQAVRIKDITVPEKVAVINDGEQLVLKIVAQAMPKEGEEVEAAVGEEAGEAPAGEAGAKVPAAEAPKEE